MRATIALLGAVIAGLVGCGDDSAGPRAKGDRGTGSGALGASASTRTLARTRLGERPARELAWLAHETQLAPGETIAHRHELSFVYARRGSHFLRAAGPEAPLGEGAGAAVDAGTRHRHRAGRHGSNFWEIRLARPGTSPPPHGAHARRVFQSRPLEGIPTPAEGLFIEVTVPPHGGRTTIHTHPGPEFIYQLSGRIDYQNAIIGTRQMRPGDAEGIPPDTAVQKRNPFVRPGAFLSLFLLDPGRPFAPRADF